jgi:hypothetical protein
MGDTNSPQIQATGEASGFIPAPGDKVNPIAVIDTNSIRVGFDATCLRQAFDARSAHGVPYSQPQVFVPNIFEAKPAGFRPQTHRIYRTRRFRPTVRLWSCHKSVIHKSLPDAKVCRGGP